MRHIRSKDLNLLTIFEALWRERNVTLAAKALHMTQPALSRALGKLRDEYNDPLFVRASRGVTPTDKAHAIAATITNALSAIDDTYTDAKQLDLAAVNRVINITTTDYFETIAAVKLVPKLLEVAPGLVLNFRRDSGRVRKEAMERGDIDLVVAGIYEDLPEGFYQQKLVKDPYRTAVRKQHPIKSMSVQEFTKYPHILVTPQGDLKGIVDQSLQKQKQKRHIAIGLPHFLSAGWMLVHSDLILTAPGMIIENLRDVLQLRDFAPPVTVPDLVLFQVWHARSDHDPLHKWLRQQIAAIFR